MAPSWLAATFAEGELRISVRDQGSGIEPEFLPRIFDLFAQANQSLDRSQGGLGIGLARRSTSVEQHDGARLGHRGRAGAGVAVLPLTWNSRGHLCRAHLPAGRAPRA